MTLREIGNILVHPTEEISSIEKALDAYRSILAKISTIDLDATEHKINLDFDNGMAIGTTWAAMCLDDILRTKRFIRGLHLAIESLRKEKHTPVHVLYAGTGPYATLLLPILAHYSANEVKVSLMDINVASLENVKHVIQKLGFEEHVIHYHLEDATTFQLPNAETIDILISETMQHALQTEQQVPIMYNLVPQLSEKAVVIPERIVLEIALLKMEEIADTKLQPHILGEGFELSKRQISSEVQNGTSTSVPAILQAKELLVDQLYIHEKKQPLLSVLTTIHIFDDQVLKTNESGLTAPKIICPIDATITGKTLISTFYQIGKENELCVEIK